MPTTVVSVTALGVQGGTLGANGKGHSVRKGYLVILSGADVNGWRIAAQASGVPQPGTLDGDNNWTIMQTGADPVPGDDSGRNYIAWTEARSDAIAGTGTTPWSRKDMVSYGQREYEVPMLRDYDGVPVVNAAKDRPHEPVMEKLYNPMLTIRRARRSSQFDPFDAMACQGSINAANFTIQTINTSFSVAAGTAMLHELTANDQKWTDTSPGTAYYEVMLRIEIRGQYPPKPSAAGAHAPNLSIVEIENRGFFYLPGGVLADKRHAYYKQPDPSAPGDGTKFLKYPNDPSYGAYADKDILFPVNTPVYLKADGDMLPTTATDDEIAACKLSFKRAPTKSWSGWIN